MRLSDLKSGDLLYWRGKGLYAWLVRKWTRSEWSHIAVFYRNGGDACFIDAAPRIGVRSHFIANDWPDAAQHTHCAWYPATFAYAMSFVGQKYDFLDAIRAAVGLPSKHRGYMCSEFAAALMRHMGWGWPANACPTPQQVADVVDLGAGYRVERLDP